MKNLSRDTTSPILTEEDKTFDLTLRPKTWQDYIGQEKIKKNIQIIIEAAKKRGESCCEHLLFYGNSGLGKTTLSYLVAKELGANIRQIAGPAIEKVGDLAAILTNLNEGDVLFIDELHRLNRLIEEFTYPALEDFKLNLVLGKGPMARTMEMKLPRFTLIGATTRLALLSAPLRNRFGATFQLDFYKQEDIEKIIQRSSHLLKLEIEPGAIELLAKCSRFTPRVANRLLKRARDFAQVEGQGIITANFARKALEFLEIDGLGLEIGDRKILEAIIKKFEGGPAGLQAISVSAGEEEDAVLDIYEPYLMQLGFIERTPRGRVATRSAYQHLGISFKNNQRLLS
ncbi:MAG: Holliday junction branch migration DNA helicase RuvB [Candidatus Nealsonbacteria bacterium]|nr:Holliday junction branch migration DNA helicase RuvB [Candidatus Nealsonbacteria bacterium]